MKTMGLLAGMSWESSSVYYQLINRQVQQRLGGVHSAKALIYSFDFGEDFPAAAIGALGRGNASCSPVSATRWPMAAPISSPSAATPCI